MELNQVLDLQLTQDEVDMMAELLRSGNAPKILLLMMRSFASSSDENVKFLMKTITELANATIDRANTAVLKKQKVIESMEAIMPPGLARYPYGNVGVLTYILSQCNFKELYNPEQAYLALASRHMTGSPMGRMMIPQFKELLDKGDALWKDSAWLCIDLMGYGDECRDLVQWCLDNREKWDDIDNFRSMVVVTEKSKRGRKPKEAQ